MKLIRILLFPVVPVYYLVTWLRNKLYDLGWMTSTSYDLPVISVGNLSTGGTGKTPTIEYLIRLLKEDYKLATLSRGYKRKSKGFQLANNSSTSDQIGDEPFQFHSKFSTISVAVDANRQNGISNLIKLKQPEVILLDDAFQHRKVKPGFSILLTSYDNLYSTDIVLPTGNLREPRSGAKRANCIVVTKCPIDLSNSEKVKLITQLKPKTQQQVFFSSIAYSEKIFRNNLSLSLETLQSQSFTLVTGIANPKPLLEFLNSKGYKFEHLAFSDHHNFTDSEIAMLQTKTTILTTEKDYMRLKDRFAEDESVKLFYLPISFQIDDRDKFDLTIKTYLTSN